MSWIFLGMTLLGERPNVLERRQGSPRAGWEAQPEKVPRGSAECPPFSLWRAWGTSGADTAVVFQRTKRCRWSRGCVTARQPEACAPSPSRTASLSRSAAAAALARDGGTTARSAPCPAQVRRACFSFVLVRLGFGFA